jgi:hypothetical protein
MKYRKSITATVAIALLMVALYLAYWYIEKVKVGLDEKSEWSIVQVGLQRTVDIKPADCAAKFFSHGQYHAVGFWSGSQWVWFLINPSAGQAPIKVLPAAVDFYASDEDMDQVKKRGGGPSLIEFMLAHRLPSCPMHAQEAQRPTN